MSLPADLWVRHVLAQHSKAFFGYGPKGKVSVVVQGPVAVFISELTGPGMVPALMAEPFGRLCMRYINHRYVQCSRAELQRLAASAGVGLLSVGSDLDFEAGVSVGVAVAEQPFVGGLSPRPAPHLAARLCATRADEGPALATVWLPDPLPEPDAAGAWLQRWADRSAAIGRDLRQAVSRPSQATFLVPAGEGCLAGIILRG